MKQLEECKIGVIGAGNMGGGLLVGLLRSGRIQASSIAATDPLPAALNRLSKLGIQTTQEAASAVAGRQLLILAVKPQVAESVLSQIAGSLDASQLLISVMAGVSTEKLANLIQKKVPIVRVMPQILARVGGAATALCAGKNATGEHLKLASDLFDLVGSTVVVPEFQMDAVTGLAGSGPAYVYTIVEALADGGVRAGLERDTALKLAAQTVLGAARMILESGEDPSLLTDQVTSPGGTTIAGLHKLEEKGLRDALISAVQAATDRSRELSGS